MRYLSVALCCLPLLAGAARAQSPDFGPSLRAAAALRIAAALPAARDPVRNPLAADLLGQRAVRRGGPGTVLMIVGGAVAVAGILADEGLLIVGGVAVAGYGLYLNLR